MLIRSEPWLPQQHAKAKHRPSLTGPRGLPILFRLLRESSPIAPLHDMFGRPLHDLRISVMDACNFRCPYCMPAEVFNHAYHFLKPAELLSFEEITRIADIFVRLGVVKVKLTGGEPLLRPWLPELVRNLSSIEGIQDLAIITNGA